MKVYEKINIVTALCMLCTLLTAMTCDDSNVYTTRVVLQNNTNAPIFVAEYSADNFEKL